MKKTRKIRSQGGQAMYEMLMVIPAFLLLFALAIQVFSVQFNAQYVHIKSRSELMEEVSYQPCTAASKSAQKGADTPGMIMKNNGATGTSRDNQGRVEASAQIVCQ